MKINKREFSRELGRRLTMVRRQLGFSRPELAERFGISSNALGKNEHGESIPNPQTLHRLASDYDISMDWLFFNKGPMYHKEKKPMEELKKELDLARQQLAVSEKEKPLEGKEMGTAAVPRLTPELRELVEQMGKIPLLYHEILAHFHRFKRENKELP
jgi:transcriptional regulator with XRE-family HTH domain